MLIPGWVNHMSVTAQKAALEWYDRMHVRIAGYFLSRGGLLKRRMRNLQTLIGIIDKVQIIFSLLIITLGQDAISPFLRIKSQRHKFTVFILLYSSHGLFCPFRYDDHYLPP